MELFTPGHLIVVAIAALVLFFGWKQLPDMARSMGRSLRIFKTEIKGMTQDDKERDKAAEAAKAEQPQRALPPAQVVPNESARPRPRPTPNGASAQRPERAAQ
jgi:sec-independent protein translocase protein TatA